MSNPAEELRRAREAAGLSLEDVERRTRVQSHYLKAIEEGNYSALPGHSYARAIIRTYAQCLGVSPAPILRDYEGKLKHSATVEAPKRSLPSRKERYAARRGRRKDWKTALPEVFSSKQLLIGALSLVLILGVASTLYFVDVFGSGPEGDESASPETSEVREEGPPSEERGSPQAASLSGDGNEVSVRLVKTSESNKHGDEYAIGHADKVVVTIKASAESWFRARGGGPTASVMKDGYIKAGQTETFTHSEWISLHLGKPDKIELRVNGYLVDTEGQKDPQTYQFRLDDKTDEKADKDS
ncbi:cytoskeletal protein RodZ [Planifilum fimeticola]|uniref:Cytoskeletal protein RodZ n=1 Tax=Planifilum fimeticola TaxID=201975 RepID=A0A2T0LHM0_9BACL|nr:RodZ domain-containing protein [Planifilum fimeticola]PRX41843.1 cytoskeletal protein RodZ [Planifilum fimeticola]